MMHTIKRKHVNTIVGLWLSIIVINWFALPSITHAQEKETITWSIVAHPPFHFVTGPDAGTGSADQLMQLMQDRLTQYDHQIEVFPNFIRSTESIDQGTRMCSSLYWYWPIGHPARNQRAYSMPTAFIFASHLVIRQRDRHLFGETVSFEDLLHNQNLVFGHPAGRAYPPQLEAVLNAYLGVEARQAFSPREQIDLFRSKSNIYVRTGEDMLAGSLKMLITERVDYLVYPPAITSYLIKQGIDIAMIPIAELRDTPANMISFACSPTGEGRQVIREINAILKTERDTPEYRAMMEWCVEPKEREDEYWKLYEEQLLTVFE